MSPKRAKYITLPPILAVFALIGVMLNVQAAAAETGVEVGFLTCRGVPNSGYNWLVHSSTDVNCVFHTSLGEEHYRGQTGMGLGLDLAWRPLREFHFIVVMGSSDFEIGAYALAGSFGGVNASVSVGATVGVSALVGGGENNISLQPLAVETGAGLGAAAGLTYLVLEPNA